MKKVFQTIVGGPKSNCMQAVVASLFEKELEDIPKFIEIKDGSWFSAMIEFYREHGYEITCFNPGHKNRDLEFTKEILKVDGGVNGYWDATVKSQTFKDKTHAVVIDKEMNVVHDPNPNEKALSLEPKDIISIMTVGDNWHIEVDGTLVKTKRL